MIVIKAGNRGVMAVGNVLVVAVLFGAFCACGEEAFLQGNAQRGATLDAYANPNMRIEVDFALTSENPRQQRIIGADHRGVGLCASVYVNSKGEFSFGAGDVFSSYSTGLPVDTVRHVAVIDFAAKKVSLSTDGRVVFEAEIDKPCTRRATHPLSVLARTVSPTGKTYEAFSTARIYGVRILEGGRLVRSYAPVRRNGVPGLLDSVGGHFADYGWRIPHWDPFLSQPGALGARHGHIQGFCVSKEFIYVTQDGSFTKLDWRGRAVKRANQPGRRVHVGDVCLWKGRLYAAICVYPGDVGFERNPGTDRPMPGCIQVMDTDFNVLKTVPICRPPDGIVCIDGVIYIGMGQARLKGTWRGNWYGKFDAETLEPICEPFMIDHGYEATWGVQNMTTDGECLYVNYYTPVEGAGTPNFIKYDRDFKVLDATVLGHGQGVSFVPGGKDGARRFLSCVTINGTFNAEDVGLEVQGLFTFHEWRGGRDVRDISHYDNYFTPMERW